MLRWQAIRHIFFLDVLFRGDVVLVMHGNQMGMGVRDMVSGKCQSDASHASFYLKCLGDLLRHIHDVMR